MKIVDRFIPEEVLVVRDKMGRTIGVHRKGCEVRVESD